VADDVNRPFAEARSALENGFLGPLGQGLAAPMDRSVLRRGLILVALVLPGYVLNYALLIGATHLLETAAFGIFYTAISTINVLFAPSVILALFVSRHVAQIRASGDTDAAIAAFRGLFRTVAHWGAVCAALALAALALAGSLIGVESLVLIVLIIAATYTAYLADAVRAAFQGLQRFVVLGLMGLSWMAVRFALGILGLVLVARPWAGLTGVLVAGVLACGAFFRLVVRGRAARPESAPAFPVQARKLVQFAASFGLFSALVYLDVLLGYFFLERDALGIYAASSVLPKAIIVLSMPVGQVLFPVLISEESRDRVRPMSVAKGLVLTLFVSGAGTGLLVALSDLFCSGTYGVKLCDPGLMTLLALSAVPICLLRVFVMLQLAREVDLHPLLLAIPLAAYVAYLLGPGDYGVHAFAEAYVTFAWATLGFYALACLGLGPRYAATAGP
jgi:hypothetical protein